MLNKDNKIVGIAMMKLRSADNISYIVPSIVINTFLNDIKDGKVDGFPQTRTRVQNIENQVMKDYLGLKDDFGILVSSVDVSDTEFKENDVLVSINDKKISNDGKIDSKYGKVSFNYEIDTKQIGETVKFEIIRNKNKINVDYKVKVSKEDMGKVIGKQGKVAKSIRTVAKSIGAREHKKVSVEFID